MSKHEVYVIGLACRMPESRSASELWKNLVQAKDMVTADERRWPLGHAGLPERSGKLPELDRFDAAFFRVHGPQARRMEPQLKLLLEVSWEALIDAQLDPADLRDADAGVYIGATQADANVAWARDETAITGYENTGSAASMFANRLSFFYDFHGPSKCVDTACSSSLVAFDDAVRDLQSGRCSTALVGGTNTTLWPAAGIGFNRLNMLSEEGACRSFDAGANGYVRAEGVGVVVLTTNIDLASHAYAKVLATGSNSDGYTEQGITYPSAQQQMALSYAVCNEADIDPSTVSYVEAHGTGTLAGDGQELEALEGVYARTRTPNAPLLIGSIKSNLGHCEGASGIAGLIKVLLAFEHGALPPNLHFTAPNPSSDALVRGLIQVPVETQAWAGGRAAVFSFGFGGTNAVALLEGRPSDVAPRPQRDHAFALAWSRTEDGARHLLSHTERPFTRPGRDVRRFPWRSSLENGKSTTRHIERAPTQVVFAFSGLGGEWAAMGAQLYANYPAFSSVVRECDDALPQVDIVALLTDADVSFDDARERTTALTVMQLGLVALLEQWGLRPDAYVGYSAGELACAAMDGILTPPEAARAAWSRGVAASTVEGSVVVTELSVDEAAPRLLGSTGCSIAGVNAPRHTTLSGPVVEMAEIIDGLLHDGIYAERVATAHAPYHSSSMEPARQAWERSLSGISRHDRSARWLWSRTHAPSHVDGTVLAAGLTETVAWSDALAEIPEDSLMIEIGPSSRLASVIRQARPDIECLSLVGPTRSVERGVADLWLAGVYLEPSRERPSRIVREAQVAWDHRESYPVPTWRDFVGGHVPGVESLRITLDLTGAHRFVLDHDIDGRILVPGVAYLESAWKAIALREGIPQSQCPVTLRDVTFHQAVQVPAGVDELTLDVVVLPGGSWSVLRAGELVANGASQVRPLAAPTAPLDNDAAVTLRPATSDDIPALWELECLAQPVAMRTPTTELAARIARGCCYVASDATGRTLGAVYAQRIARVEDLACQTRSQVSLLSTPEGSVLQLIELVADPTAQDQRVGERLLAHIKRFAHRTEAIEKIVAITRCRQWPAHRGGSSYEDYVRSGEDTGPDLHRSGGATIAGVVKDWWPEDTDNDGFGVLVVYGDTDTRSTSTPVTRSELPMFLARGIHRVSPGIAADELPRLSATWADLGFDSLALIAFRAWIQRSFTATLRSDLLFHCPTVGDLLEALEHQADDDDDGEHDSVEWLTGDEVYSGLLRRGYRYGPAFKSIRSVSADGRRATVAWEGDWVPFLDGIFQAALVGRSDSNLLVVPVGLRSFSIDPPCPGLGDLVNVEMDSDRSFAGCAFARFEGYRVRSLARATEDQPEAVMLVSRFVPYGDTVSTDERAYAYVREQEASFADWLGATLPEHFDAHPHLRRVYELLQQSRRGVTPLRDELLDAPEGIMLRIARDLLGDPERVTRTLEGPLQAINRHPEHGRLYAEDLLARGFSATVLDRMLGIVEENHSTSLEVCEIGAGTGGLTRQILARPSLAGIERYVATDVTSAFVPEMERHLDGRSVEHARWNLNENLPADLGTFDLVVASNALHVAQDIPTALRHVRDGLREGGFLCFFEATNLVTPLLWGLDAACWNFADERDFGLWTSIDHWKRLIVEAGLQLVATHRAMGDHAAMFLARKPATAPRSVVLEVPPDTADEVRIESWLAKARSALREESDATVWLRGSDAVTALARCVRREPDGHRIRALAGRTTSLMDDTIVTANLSQNVIESGVWGRIHEERRPLPAPTDITRQWASLHIQAGETRLEWHALAPPGPDHIDVRPTVIGLNFRDVVLASGRMRPEEFALPQYVVDGVPGFGIEFAGRDADGERVLGTAPGALATHINAPKQLLFHGVPEHWSDAEAVTVPVAYTTVYYALDMRARIRPGDTVLVHSGAGGLGLATLHVLFARGHEVFTTCGTEEKRAFLKARFPQLDDAHIGNSRRPGFEELVKKSTAGRGVDIVINPLSGALAEESLRCVAPYGCFLEVGKYDMVTGGSLSMAPLMRNVTVAAVDLSQALDEPNVAAEILHRMAVGMENGEVVPLPVTLHSIDDIGSAIRTMGRGEHIGKLVVQLEREPRQVPLPLTPKPRSSWLITGGLGGVGLEVCRWLADRGAARLVLSSRRGLRTATQARRLAELRDGGLEIEVSTLDACDPAEAAALVELANRADAPLQGVLHLAMVLEDRLLPEHDVESWLTAIRPKAHAARHLDAATRNIDSIEYFVCFSSVAATFGNPGQGNYAYANVAMERVCAERETAGLHALAVRWGPIADVGWVADQRNQLGRDISRMAYQPIASCIDCLERLMVSDRRGTVTVFAERLESGSNRSDATSARERGLVSSVLRILGRQEDQVHEQDTLADCGIDSLQIVEVQATLHRHTGQTINFSDIQRLTIADLHSRAGERMTTALPMAGVSRAAAVGPIIERTELVPAQPRRVIYLLAGFATDPSEVASGLPMILVRWERAATLDRLLSALEADIDRLPAETVVEVWSHSIGLRLVDWLRAHSAKLCARMGRWVAISPPSATYANAFLDELSLEDLRSVDLAATRDQWLALPFFLTRHERTPLSVRAVRHQAVLARETGEGLSEIQSFADLVVLPEDDGVAVSRARGLEIAAEVLEIPGDHELISLDAHSWRTIDRHGAASIVEATDHRILIFPGQGSQSVGMGRVLFERYPSVTERASSMLGYDLVELCLEDPNGRLDDTRYTQPALYVVNALYHRAYVERGGREPWALAGHSLGEFNALVAAGRLDFDAGLRLVERRGALMSRMQGGAMAAVIGVQASEVLEELERVGLDGLDLANHNSATQVVISGRDTDIDASEKPLLAIGARWVRLRVSGAFHSRYMKPVSDAFARALSNARFHAGRVPVVANATARPYEDDVEGLLVRQLREPVLWEQTIDEFERGGACSFVELGPGTTLTRLLERR